MDTFRLSKRSSRFCLLQISCVRPNVNWLSIPYQLFFPCIDPERADDDSQLLFAMDGENSIWSARYYYFKATTIVSGINVDRKNETF